MAYMSQEKKSKIAAALKTVVPAGWKYTLAVRNHSTIVMTIRSAPVDLLAEMTRREGETNRPYADVNHYHVERQFQGETLKMIKNIIEALNLDNHDNSDLMTDYYDVGHYVSLDIGRWDKPFQVTQ